MHLLALTLISAIKITQEEGQMFSFYTKSCGAETQAQAAMVYIVQVARISKVQFCCLKNMQCTK